MLRSLLGTGWRRASVIAALVPAIGVLAYLAGRPARAQVDLTIELAMTKGASDAPVTIVEFSDYQ